MKEARKKKGTMKKISRKHVVDELAAIGFARATHFLSVSEGELTIRDTDTLSAEDQAAIASIEQTSNGVRLKFYDKMKALELLGKLMGLFEGDPGEKKSNNLRKPCESQDRCDIGGDSGLCGAVFAGYHQRG